MLAPSGPEGDTFEGPDGAGFAWKLAGLQAGWVKFREMDHHFWPLLEEFFSWQILQKNNEVASRDLKSSKTRNAFNFGAYYVIAQGAMPTYIPTIREEALRDPLCFKM